MGLLSPEFDWIRHQTDLHLLPKIVVMVAESMNVSPIDNSPEALYLILGGHENMSGC